MSFSHSHAPHQRHYKERIFNIPLLRKKDSQPLLPYSTHSHSHHSVPVSNGIHERLAPGREYPRWYNSAKVIKFQPLNILDYNSGDYDSEPLLVLDGVRGCVRIGTTAGIPHILLLLTNKIPFGHNFGDWFSYPTRKSHSLHCSPA